MINAIEEIVLDAQKAGQTIVLTVFSLVETITIIVSAIAVLISVLIRNFPGRKFLIIWSLFGQLLMILVFFLWRQSIRG